MAGEQDTRSRRKVVRERVRKSKYVTRDIESGCASAFNLLHYKRLLCEGNTSARLCTFRVRRREGERGQKTEEGREPEINVTFEVCFT